jgi:hypothetical protein
MPAMIECRLVARASRIRGRIRERAPRIPDREPRFQRSANHFEIQTHRKAVAAAL